MFQVMGTPSPDRNKRVKELNELGFKWANIGEEPYWMDQVVAMRKEAYAELTDAAGKLWQVFDKAARFVLRRRDLYAALSIPEVLWDGLDHLEPGPPGFLSRYARFDFAVHSNGTIKLLELNADTPTGYVEAAVATPWMCRQYDLDSPNEGMAELIRHAWWEEAPEYAACIGYGTHAEDSGTIEMLVQHSGREIKCVDCLELWVDEGFLKDGQNRKIASLFALYPKEWMAVDEGGEAFAFAIEEGNVRLFNPLQAVLLQSKGLQAVIWGLHEFGAGLFNQAEHDAIARYMLPTYNMPVLETDYVSKSMFGREGGSVQMYNRQGELEIKDEEGFDTSVFFSRVYQQRMDLPRLQFDSGEFHLLTGLFVLNGTPCGLLGRAGGLITGNASHFIAMGVSRD